jgi:hypothetical protein
MSCRSLEQQPQPLQRHLVVLQRGLLLLQQVRVEFVGLQLVIAELVHFCLDFVYVLVLLPDHAVHLNHIGQLERGIVDVQQQGYHHQYLLLGRQGVVAVFGQN